jgi:hypothetical protein
MILLCVLVDFTNPLLPGSVRFDPSESIEALASGGLELLGCSTRPRGCQADRGQLEAGPGVAPLRSGELALAARPRVVTVRILRHRPDDLTPTSATEDH